MRQLRIPVKIERGESTGRNSVFVFTFSESVWFPPLVLTLYFIYFLTQEIELDQGGCTVGNLSTIMCANSSKALTGIVVRSSPPGT